jgi:hypothetical protein
MTMFRKKRKKGKMRMMRKKQRIEMSMMKSKMM